MITVRVLGEFFDLTRCRSLSIDTAERGSSKADRRLSCRILQIKKCIHISLTSEVAAVEGPIGTLDDFCLSLELYTGNSMHTIHCTPVNLQRGQLRLDLLVHHSRR